MEKLRKLLKRLFFYSSRQLLRRKRSYLSIFATSVVLLTLVMTFLEMTESVFLRNVEISKNGYYHVLFREVTTDYTDKIASDSRVESAWAIPYTSLLASSDDASSPARVVVPTDDIYDKLDVRYVWGRAPGDGEIAVSTELYNAYSYLTAGEENELYFKATEMTYFPLTVSGIFEANDEDAGYVFVTRSTADAIDRETRAKVKYDLYFRAKYASDRSVPSLADYFFRELRLSESQWQKLKPLKEIDQQQTKWHQYEVKYEEYVNNGYLEDLESQGAIPLIAISMPVIAIAALMMASFMANWVTSNSEEYGILGAIGANRRQICTISAGQILLIGLIAAVPVILISAGVSNIYISAFNSASSTDVDYIFAVPWMKLIEAALWWCVLACFFTYIGIARITMELPFVLISGQAKYKIPYVARSSDKLMRAKDKILSLSLLKAKRGLKSRIVTAIITSLICIVCGVFVTLLIALRSETANILDKLNQYAADLTVSEKEVPNSYARIVPLSEELAAELEKQPLIETIAMYDIISGFDLEKWAEQKLMDVGDTIYQHYPHVKNENSYSDYNGETIITLNRTAMDLASFAVTDGDPYRIFEDPSAIVAVVPAHAGTVPSVGDKITVYGTQKVTMREDTTVHGDIYSYHDVRQTESYEYTICAVIVPLTEYEDLKIPGFTYILSDEGRQLCGLEGGQWSKILGWFREDADKQELRTMYENLVESPAFLRYDVTAREVQTESEERIQTATTVMLCFFFGMLYLSFCTMTYTDAFLKVTKERREIAILRQIGADDRDIHKSVRAENYPTIIMAVSITLVLVLLVPALYIMPQVAWIRAIGDKDNFPPEVIEKLVDEVIQTGLGLYALLALSVLVHIPSAVITILGSWLPTKRILNDTIAEGIRKDTD
ncbi:MAG: ABC transporter permease [Clostridia bacterium]|nr:ABC transporter permease [Clostridia bacterium]